MHETTLAVERVKRTPVSIATYAAITATLLIMVLSAITFAATSGDESSRPAYDPNVGLVGFANPD